MSTTMVTPAPAQASVTNDDNGMVRLEMSTPFWNVMDVTLNREELATLHSVIAAYFLTNGTAGTEWGN